MLIAGRLWRSSLLSVLCVVLAVPALAATNIYMSITGGKPGQFTGDSKSPHGSQWIRIEQINESVVAPRDSATGQASGKRQHETVKIVKVIDASSPQLEKAAAAGAHLNEVVFQFYRSNAEGKEELYETIRLTDAIIASIQNRRAGSAAGHSDPPMEDISFNYEKIEITYAPQKQSPASVKQAPAVVKPSTSLPR